MTAKAKAAASRAAAQTVGVAKRVMAYRAKVAQPAAHSGRDVRPSVLDCQAVSLLGLLAGHVRLGRGGGEERIVRL